jgi:hypothetical protein
VRIQELRPISLRQAVNLAEVNNPSLKAFGTFKATPVSIEQMGRRNREAVQLMSEAGWE